MQSTTRTCATIPGWGSKGRGEAKGRRKTTEGSSTTSTWAKRSLSARVWRAGAGEEGSVGREVDDTVEDVGVGSMVMVC